MSGVRARAPGRVNLIGEHTDYNGGFVLPCAIAYETVTLAQPREDGAITAETAFGSDRFDAGAVPGERCGDWRDYLRGVALELRRAGVDLAPTSLHVTGNVPSGAGLSSSAAFEISVALALSTRGGASLDRLQLAMLAQRAENEHAGARVGIMDPFAVLFGRAGNAILLDTRSLEYRYVPVPPQAAVVICNTMTRRHLTGGGYNDRRQECEQAVRALRTHYPQIQTLRDVSPEQLQAAREALDPVLFRRARHVTSENARVLEAAAALTAGDLPRFGMLMNASQSSLRDDYGVSSRELDLLVDLGRAHGAFGARMTGGGFGGCTVNLVAADRAGAFRGAVAAAYQAETGIAPEIYDGTPSAGASVTSDG